MSTNLDTARQAWGDDLPDWVQELAHACDAANQRQVAERLRYSITVVSQVLGRKYGGSLAAVEAAVRGAFLNQAVACPVLGDIEHHICRAHQRARFSTSNSVRVQLYHACRSGCPHSLLNAVAGGKEAS